MRFLLHRRSGVVAAIVLLLPILWPSSSLAKKEDFIVVMDSQLRDQGSVTVWLGYLLARAKYRDDHNVRLPPSGDIVPSFLEEVYARLYAVQIYQEWKAENKDWSDVYWETLSDIKNRGFMEAYVWTFLRRPAWPTSDKPRNAAAFQDWSRAHLQNHNAKTHGALVVHQKINSR